MGDKEQPMSASQKLDGTHERGGLGSRPPSTQLHPAEPEHPMLVEGGVIDGDTVLMFRCLIEEYLLAGHSPQAIRSMCMQPGYQALFAAAQTLGRDRSELILADAAKRIGHHRVRFVESTDNEQPATLTIGMTSGAPVA